ncbi:mbp-1 interacting protein-2a family protein [Cardiosporidium cionae]|uniref:Mbp-1 interacting protein-2a family protein n=1 Tax=Cardiosporidium cionae TaxID=476202 RepID=A0ABQ7JBV3_9APIC|nr:mbp-1 interacting protein-2a family protein [Cardiosporidium cionae]|eukprot:KAF8821488.1 mbp-1 interacting protein-2a family protein [Cardiosporidium cionae]
MSASATVIAFVIVGKGDAPLYEADLSTPGKRDDSPYLNQFILHQALDALDDSIWHNNNMYLNVCDTFKAFIVSGFCTAGHVKFMLLHRQRGSDEKIRLFFTEIHELYLKILLNPLYEPNGKITSVAFDQYVRLSAKKYLH